MLKPALVGVLRSETHRDRNSEGKLAQVRHELVEELPRVIRYKIQADM